MENENHRPARFVLPEPPDADCKTWEYDEFAQALVVALLSIADWLQRELETATSIEPEHLSLFERLHRYYVRISEQLPALRTVFEREVTHERTSLQSLLFWEVCRARSLARGTFLSPEQLSHLPNGEHLLRQRRACVRDWPVARQYGLSADVYGPIPVSDFSQATLEQALRVMLPRWKQTPYHPEAADYAEALLDRTCALFCTPLPIAVLNLIEWRQTLTDLSTTLGRPVAAPTFEYLYRSQTRYHEMSRDLLRYSTRMLVQPPPRGACPRADLLRGWCAAQARNADVRAALAPALVERRMELALPPGDRAYCAFAHPVVPNVPGSILAALYDKDAAPEALTVASKPLVQLFDAPWPHTMAAHEWLALRLLDMLFCDDAFGPDGFSRFVVHADTLETRLLPLHLSDEPALVQWFSRYFLYHRRRVHLRDDLWESVAAWTELIEHHGGALQTAVTRCLQIASDDLRVAQPPTELSFARC